MQKTENIDENKLSYVKVTAPEQDPKGYVPSMADCFFQMTEDLKELSNRREAFFSLLGEMVFWVCTEDDIAGKMPAPKGMKSSHYIDVGAWEVQEGLSRRLLIIQPNETRRFSFRVEQYGTILDIRIDAYGENTNLIEAVEDLLPFIAAPADVVVRRSVESTSVVVRVEADNIFRSSMHLENALRTISMLFDQAVEHAGADSLH